MRSQLRSGLSVEWNLFLALPRNARFLLGASTLFAFAAPVMSVFISAYIMRNSQDVVKVMAFQLASYTGVPFTFYLNGVLLRRFGAAPLYACGMLLSGAALMVMTLLTTLSMTGVVLAGLVMGAATGFHWANRNQLSLVCTHDACRNYYFGLESFFYCLSSVTMPAAVGAFIAWWGGAGGQGLDSRTAYRLVAGGVAALAVCASAVLLRGSFSRIPSPMLVRLRHDRVWCGLLAMAALKGGVQVFQATVPAMLVMRVLGRGEHALGLVQSGGALLAAVLIYLIGRNTRPEHRLGVLAAALVINMAGAGSNAAWFSSSSVLLFLACLLISQPMLELAYSAIQLQVLDRVTLRQKDSGYAYFCGHELGLYAGRLAGAGAFILVARGLSDTLALRYVLAVAGAVQLLMFPLARGIVQRMREESGDRSYELIVKS
jgi:YQGE family putative transporter